MNIKRRIILINFVFFKKYIENVLIKIIITLIIVRELHIIKYYIN